MKKTNISKFVKKGLDYVLTGGIKEGISNKKIQMKKTNIRICQLDYVSEENTNGFFRK